MGGYGSGRSAGTRQPCLEELKNVDIRYMKQAGLLEVGRTGTLSWSIRGTPLGSISYRMHSDRLGLSYWVRRTGETESHIIDMDVLFDETTCNYGGSRRWFLCPKCGKRVAVLYEHGHFFHCRHCVKLPYGVEQESKHDRATRRCWKLREGLKESGSLFEPIPLWTRPKGMHWSTFWRIVERDEVSRQDLMERITRLCGWASKQYLF